MLNFRKGFTLIELLVVIVILSLLLSVILPVSVNTLKKYQTQEMATEVLEYINQLKGESFYKKEKKVLSSNNGKLLVNGMEINKFPDVFFQIDEPITFYENGSCSGGVIKIFIGSYNYEISIKQVECEISLR
ncbi:MAG: prepilin-type N-terminal cleavage/methylation domain-containing protein [Sulfurihydrogenibium sp.]